MKVVEREIWIAQRRSWTFIQESYFRRKAAKISLHFHVLSWRWSIHLIDVRFYFQTIYNESSWEDILNDILECLIKSPTFDGK